VLIGTIFTAQRPKQKIKHDNLMYYGITST
jgi:hypothetical protein